MMIHWDRRRQSLQAGEGRSGEPDESSRQMFHVKT